MTKEWDRWRKDILEYYVVKGKTLGDTRKIMTTEHGFTASTRAYRSRLKRWGVSKYSKPPRRESAPAQSSAHPPVVAEGVSMKTSSSDPGSSGTTRQMMSCPYASQSVDTPSSAEFSTVDYPYSPQGHSPLSAVPAQSIIAQSHFSRSHDHPFSAAPLQPQQQRYQRQDHYHYVQPRLEPTSSRHDERCGRQHQHFQPDVFHSSGQSHSFTGLSPQLLTSSATLQQDQQQQHRGHHQLIPAYSTGPTSYVGPWNNLST